MTELLLTSEMVIRTGSKVIASEVESKRSRQAYARSRTQALRACRMAMEAARA